MRCLQLQGIAYGPDAMLTTPLAILVTTLANSGPGSLRQALADASPGDTITVASNGRITLTSGDLLITKSMTIAGPGPEYLSIDGNGTNRGFFVSAEATVAIVGLTITNGHHHDGGGIDNYGVITLSNIAVCGSDGTLGGGIHNSGTLTLNNSTLSGNFSAGGGDIYQEHGTCMLSNTIVAGATASFRPNIQINGGTYSGGNNLTNGNPLLAPLGNYGGPTQTMPPLSGLLPLMPVWIPSPTLYPQISAVFLVSPVPMWTSVLPNIRFLQPSIPLHC